MIRIAAEEAWAPASILKKYGSLLEEKPESWDPGFRSLWGFFLGAAGIARQIVFLTSPGVQVFEAGVGTALARETNDELFEKISFFENRYTALAAIAPQDPGHAVKELQRTVTRLGFKGAAINSHTQGEYLDEPKFAPILEAAEALDVPIYLHPNTPPPAMIAPFLPRGLDGAIYGFAVETGMHVLRMIVGGVFDRFPRLKVVVGHLGEGLPFWLFRLDYMHRSMVASNRYPGAQPLKKKPSDYLKENVWVTTSGMQWAPAILFCQQVLGPERVMYAMDYPYQFVPEEVEVTDRLPVSEEVRKMLYQTNAEKVFRL